MGIASNSWLLAFGEVSDARTHLLEKIVASKKFAGSIEPLVVGTDDQNAILALAREGDFDAVIAVLPADNPHDRLLPAGPGIMRKKDLGTDHLRACDSMIIRIWRVADGKQLGAGFAYPCAVVPQSGCRHAWPHNPLQVLTTTAAQENTPTDCSGDRAVMAKQVGPWLAKPRMAAAPRVRESYREPISKTHQGQQRKLQRKSECTGAI